MDLSLQRRTQNLLANTEILGQGKDLFRTVLSESIIPYFSTRFLSFSNPYGGARSGIASVAPAPSKAPISGTLHPDNIPELSSELQPIKDCFLGVIDALKSSPLGGGDKRLLSESEKGVAILLKRLARGDISSDISNMVLQMTVVITSYEFASAQSVLTELVSHEWRDHKDWLKGIKALLQLARKTWNR
jgi:protein transport protein SEC31